MRFLNAVFLDSNETENLLLLILGAERLRFYAGYIALLCGYIIQRLRFFQQEISVPSCTDVTEDDRKRYVL